MTDAIVSPAQGAGMSPDFAELYMTARLGISERLLNEIVSRNSLDDALHRVKGETDVEFVSRIVCTFIALRAASLPGSDAVARERDDVSAYLAEAKTLLVQAFQNKAGYKGKINSALWRLTYVERVIRSRPAAEAGGAATKSAPLVQASQNNAERMPSSNAASGGADTEANPQPVAWCGSPDLAKSINDLSDYADALDHTERPSLDEYDVTADIRKVCQALTDALTVPPPRQALSREEIEAARPPAPERNSIANLIEDLASGRKIMASDAQDLLRAYRRYDAILAAQSQGGVS